MDLPKELKIEIAESIIIHGVPIITLSMALMIIGIILFGGQQYHRIIPAVMGLALTIPPLILARKNKPFTGMIFIVSGIGLVIITGMTVSGGPTAPAYTATLVMMTVATVFYGTRGGIIFAFCTLAAGGLFSILIRRGIIPHADEPATALLLWFHGLFLIMQFVFVLIPVRLLFKALSTSHRQQAELQRSIEARKQAENELQSILNKTPDIIFRLDPENRITFISEAVRKYGHAPETYVGHSIVTFIHPDDYPAARNRILENKNGDSDTDGIEIRLSLLTSKPKRPRQKTAGRTWGTFSISGEALYSDDARTPGSFAGIQGIARDVSNIRRFEQQMNRLAAVVEQAYEDVFITDQKGVIQYVNPRFEEITGYKKHEVIGRTPRMLQNDKHDDTLCRELQKAMKEGRPWKGRIWDKKKTGELILQDATITPIFDASHSITGFASIRRDVTTQERLEKQLFQAQKMEAIGTLAGGIAHDFNNILSGVIGYAELALLDIEDRSDTRRKLERILGAGHRAAGLVKQILSFSRSQAGEVKPIVPADIIEEVLKLMRASLPATIEIKQFINSRSYILADATHMHQVLMNLCTNAGYAMKEGRGELSVSLETVFLKPEDLAYRPDLVQGEYVKISVKDTGIGMTKEVQEKAFDPFFTTKEQGEGTGIGLSTVHGIVSELFGFISLQSEPGHGTVATVFIPTTPPPPITEERPSPIPLRGGTERILFVDDEQIQIDLAVDMLTSHGYQVTAFSDSTLALADFQRHPDAYDLVITDMTMPKITGDLLAQKIKQERSDIPVIMCSGFNNVMDEQSATALNIRAFLYKPVAVADLLSTIREVISPRLQ